jgi:hypothetical protein
MKLLTILLAACAITIAATYSEMAETPIKGTWKMVKSKYGDEKEYIEPAKGDLSLKMFTGTRWSAAAHNPTTKKIKSSAGGTYTIRGNQYIETVEYFSWGEEAVGKTFTFTMTIENGMLHQNGFMEWEGNTKYVVDEWYMRVD